MPRNTSDIRIARLGLEILARVRGEDGNQKRSAGQVKMTRLLLDESPLYVVPTLAKKMGLNEAIVLQQLHWALRRDSVVVVDGVRWVKIGMEKWEAFFPFWSGSTIRRTFGTLREQGVVMTKRGREANVYAIDYAALEVRLTQPDGSICAPEVGQDDTPPCKREETERGTTSDDVVAADGDGALTLPGLAAPSAPAEPAAKPSDAAVAEVWAHYVAIFGDRLRVKELTSPRAKGIQKALAAVGDDVGTCKRAIDGLKSYRIKHPDGSKDVSLGVIFATGPHSRGNLTDQIEWWAEQAADQADVPPSVPSGHRARVMDLAVQVLKVEHQPDNDAVRERGEQAQAILAARFQLKVISDGNGKLLRFEGVA